MGVQLDRFIDTLERAGSTVAIVPGAGAVAGAFKIVIGLIQITTAVACAILLFIPAAAMGEEGSLMEYCWTHIKHGVGNILAGLLEAIPLLGTAIAIQRDMDSRWSTERTPSEAGKFMPYQSLIDDDQQNDLRNMPNDGLFDLV